MRQLKAAGLAVPRLNPAWLILVISFVLWLSARTDGAGARPSRLAAEVINRTNEKFTDVAVQGRGYPGGFGNLVSGGNATIAGYPATELDDQFTVTWRSSTGLHQKTLSRPTDFDLSGKRNLIIEFGQDGSVRAYTTPTLRPDY